MTVAHGAEIVVARLDAGRDVIERETTLLSHDESQRAARFVRARDRGRFIVARATLRRLLGSRLDLPPEAIALVTGPFGKPELAPHQSRSGLRFNLSHCDGIAVFGFSWDREIGVDVEAVRTLPDADRIALRFFSGNESKAYFDLRPADRPLAFFNCWTRKEAFIKALGEGLGFPLDRFDVSLAPGEPARLLRVDNEPGERCGWALDDFVPAAGFVGAAVTRDAIAG